MESSKIDTPLAWKSISGTPPPILPFTSITRGPSGVSLISVWESPVLTPSGVQGGRGDLQHSCQLGL